MKDVINFLGSNIVANIIGFVGLLITFLSAKKERDTKEEKYASQVNNTNSVISNSVNSLIQNNITSVNNEYIFRDSNSTSSNNNYDFLIIICLGAFFVVWAIIGKAVMTFLLLLVIALVLKYNYFGIANLKRIFVPIVMIVTVLIMVNFSPKELLNFWKDIKIEHPMDPLKNIKRILDAFLMIYSRKDFFLFLSIIGNLAIYFLISISTIADLWQPKNKIKVQKTSLIVGECIVLVLFLFLFYSVNSGSLVRNLFMSLNKVWQIAK